MAEEKSDVAKNLENLSINEKTSVSDLENENPEKLEDGLPLVEVYKLALNFYKGNLHFLYTLVNYSLDFSFLPISFHFIRICYINFIYLTNNNKANWTVVL